MFFFLYWAYLRHALWWWVGIFKPPDCVTCLGLLIVSASGTLLNLFFVIKIERSLVYFMVKMYFCDVATFFGCSGNDLTNNKL